VKVEKWWGLWPEVYCQATTDVGADGRLGILVMKILLIM
jgi:hypothetical protein